MNNTAGGIEPTKLQNFVEVIAITPKEAQKLVDGYRSSFEARYGWPPETTKDRARIANKIVGRYAKLAAATGAATALPGVIPGVGTALATVGGGLADLAASLKLQIDMCMCLIEVYQSELGGEDKKHLAFVLALAGSAEQMAANGGKIAVEKTAQKLVLQYLKGPALTTIKQLFKKVAMNFTQKAMAKAIPLGVGVVFSGSTNYALTTIVGKITIAVLTKKV